MSTALDELRQDADELKADLIERLSAFRKKWPGAGVEIEHRVFMRYPTGVSLVPEPQDIVDVKITLR